MCVFKFMPLEYKFCACYEHHNMNQYYILTWLIRQCGCRCLKFNGKEKQKLTLLVQIVPCRFTLLYHQWLKPALLQLDKSLNSSDPQFPSSKWG